VEGWGVLHAVRKPTDSPKSLEVSTSETLNGDTTYQLTFIVRDLVGNTVADGAYASNGQFATNFTTVDTQPPEITYNAPKDGDTGVATDVTVQIYFDEEMDKTTTKNAFSLTTGGTEVNGNISLSSAGVDQWLLEFNPDSALESATSYTMTVGTTAEDIPRNQLAQEFTATFETTG
jgi:hypothetical protein